MKHNLKLGFFVVFFGAVLSGCTMMEAGCLSILKSCSESTVANGNDKADDEDFLLNKHLTATGYGTAEKSDQYSRSQIKLMAMRSSKLDAYRSLSEQVYGVRLTGVTTVQNMIITHDNYRVYVDAYLRGAKVIRTVAINKDKYAGDDSFETLVEIELTPAFYKCMNGTPAMVNKCLRQPMSPAPELLTPYSSIAPTVQIASAINSTPEQCNSMDCYGYPLTSGFNRPLPIRE